MVRLVQDRRGHQELARLRTEAARDSRLRHGRDLEAELLSRKGRGIRRRRRVTSRHERLRLPYIHRTGKGSEAGRLAVGDAGRLQGHLYHPPTAGARPVGSRARRPTRPDRPAAKHGGERALRTAHWSQAVGPVVLHRRPGQAAPEVASSNLELLLPFSFLKGAACLAQGVYRIVARAGTEPEEKRMECASAAFPRRHGAP